MAARKKPVAKTNGHNVENVITFERFRTVDPAHVPRKVYIDTLGGYFYVRPVPSILLEKFNLMEKDDNRSIMEVCQEVARYFAANIFSDPEGTKPIATYEQWMTLTPSGLLVANNIIQKSLAKGGEEKNA